MKLAMIDIAKAAATHFEIKLEELCGECREPEYAWPRQFAMALCREWTGRSTTDVGAFFDRDHTTVLHAIRAVKSSRYTAESYISDKAAIRALANSYGRIRTDLEREWVQKLKDGVPFAPPPGWSATPREVKPPPPPISYDRRLFVPADSLPHFEPVKRGSISWTPSPERLRAGRA